MEVGNWTLGLFCEFSHGTPLASTSGMPFDPPGKTHSQDGMLVAGAIAAAAATALIFFAASRTPVTHDDGVKRPSRAAINAAEERAIWLRK